MGFFLGVHRSGGEGFGAAGTADAPPRTRPSDDKPLAEAGGEGGDAELAGSGSEGGACQPTMSTYGLLTSLACLNLNYHVEHHDFPAVPWSRLPAVKAAAPEYYDHLEQSPGFVVTVWRWVQYGHGWSYACTNIPTIQNAALHESAALRRPVPSLPPAVVAQPVDASARERGLSKVSDRERAGR